MYKIDNHIRTEGFDGLKVHRLTQTESLEVLLISLEKDAIFPEHSSPKDAHLLVLEGDFFLFIPFSFHALIVLSI